MGFLVPVLLFIMLVMQPMAIPPVSGLVVRALVTIFIAPCLFCAAEVEMETSPIKPSL